MTPADVEVIVDHLAEYERLRTLERILDGELRGMGGPKITSQVLGMNWVHITTHTKASILADVTERLNQVQAVLQLMGIEKLDARVK